jgi:predicted outer membrane repeat protein
LADAPDYALIVVKLGGEGAKARGSRASGHSITLTSGELFIEKNVVIRPAGDQFVVVERATKAPPFSIFHIAPDRAVRIEGFVIRNGSAPFGLGGGIYNDHGILEVENCILIGNSAAIGGAICNDGSHWGSALLTLTNSTLSGNSATYFGGGIANDGQSAEAMLGIYNSTLSNNFAGVPDRATIDYPVPGLGYGGGIYNSGVLDGMATICLNNTTLSGNVADLGGGIYNVGSYSGAGPSPGNSVDMFTPSMPSDDSGYARMTMNNCTVSSNEAQYGGGLYNYGYQFTMATAMIANTTFSDNSVTLNGGGIYNHAARVEIGNTILNAAASGGNILNDQGAVLSHGFNLSSDDAGDALKSIGDRPNTDPMLGPLGNNGGATFTHAPRSASPAIDQGNRRTIPELSTDIDQRNSPRPTDNPGVPNAAGGDSSDIGAVELDLSAEEI